MGCGSSKVSQDQETNINEPSVIESPSKGKYLYLVIWKLIEISKVLVSPSQFIVENTEDISKHYKIQEKIGEGKLYKFLIKNRLVWNSK